MKQQNVGFVSLSYGVCFLQVKRMYIIKLLCSSSKSDIYVVDFCSPHLAVFLKR